MITETQGAGLPRLLQKTGRYVDNYAQLSVALSNTSGTPNTSMSFALSNFTIGQPYEIAIASETLGGYSEMDVVTYTRTA